jgi:hypothetical protein
MRPLALLSIHFFYFLLLPLSTGNKDAGAKILMERNWKSNKAK